MIFPQMRERAGTPPLPFPARAILDGRLDTPLYCMGSWVFSSGWYQCCRPQALLRAFSCVRGVDIGECGVLQPQLKQ
jgi:hypothetical protein